MFEQLFFGTGVMDCWEHHVTLKERR